jgi:hypothetical protein
MTHLHDSIKQIREAVEEIVVRAQIRDAGRERALRRLVGIALVAPEVEVDPSVDEAHKQRVRHLVARARYFAGRIDGIPIEEVEAEIEEFYRSEMDEIAGEAREQLDAAAKTSG